MKKLFKNYNFEFDKNEIKLISSFSKQVLKQLNGNDQYFHETKAFNSILEKIQSGTETVKLTKDEYTRLKNQLAENVKHINKEMAKVWFLKKWLYKSLLVQYTSILEKHFKD